MRRLGNYLNPVVRLGTPHYSFLFALLFSLTICILSELYAYNIARDPMVVGKYIIFINVFAILYFSFRDAFRGGAVASAISVLYYFYIIYTRNYSGQELVSGIETTIVLGVLYFLLAGIIGWLKRKIDTLIVNEANEKKWLQTIIRQLPVGVVIADAKGKILQTNRQLETILGVKIPIGKVAGKDMVISTMQNGKKIKTSGLPLAQVLQPRTELLDQEFVVEKPDKSKVYISVNASPIHNNEGKIIAAASIIKDITGQKELENRKDDFINMASHELKTPVTSIKLYIDILKRQTENSKNKKLSHVAKSLRDQADRLSDLVNNLLDVSRIQTGKLNFQKESFRLDLEIKELIDALHDESEKVKIIFKKPKSVTVIADKYRIYQVLTNLLTNAVKYSPDGRKVWVSLLTTKKKVTVQVKDHGVGIAKNEQKKIFDRLYQVIDATEKTFPGLGMGLYISKEIIKRHKGKIWVESTKGKGSVFSFTLPVVKTE